jgi:hypothetical protein
MDAADLMTVNDIARILKLKPQTVAAELPPDAKRITLVTTKSCAFELFRSRKLARALAGRPVGDGVGAALAEFGTGPSDESYNPKSVNYALFSLQATQPSQIPAC